MLVINNSLWLEDPAGRVEFEIYDKTNVFYQSLGFKEFECFPTLWDKSNPCQIYVMSVN